MENNFRNEHNKVIERIMQGVLDSCKEMMMYMYDRWQSEKGYEDFSEYTEEMKKALFNANKDLKFLRASKRPFGFVFTIPGYINAEFIMYVNSKNIGVKIK